MVFRGLHGLNLVNLHVVRHIGLHDIRVVAQVVTDLTFSGQYSLSGKGLSMIDLTGGGALNISVSRLMLTGETFLVLNEDKQTKDVEAIIKNVDLKAVMAANRDRKNSKSPKKRTPKTGIWNNKLSRKFYFNLLHHQT